MKQRIGCGTRRGTMNAASTRVVELPRRGRHQPFGADLQRRVRRRPDEGEERLPVPGHEGVEVHEVAHPVADVVEAAGHDHAAVGEAEEHDLVEVLVEHLVDDVLDVQSRGRPAGWSRWARSPMPVRLGVKTAWPAAWSGPRTRWKPCAPLQAPCTNTYVATLRGLGSRAATGRAAPSRSTAPSRANTTLISWCSVVRLIWFGSLANTDRSWLASWAL